VITLTKALLSSLQGFLGFLSLLSPTSDNVRRPYMVR
jgi:hypothetical protein